MVPNINRYFLNMKVFDTANTLTVILEILKGTKTHPNSNMIYNVLKDEFAGLSLGTVYRNLIF